MTRTVKLLLVLTIMSGCAATQPRVQEVDTNLRVVAGYADVMLYHLRELIELKTSESGKDLRFDSRRELASGLRQTVWEYNVESAKICAKGLYTEVSCLPVLNPSWLTEAPNTSPTEKELERRVDWVNAHVQPLWDAACEDFKKSHPEPEAYMPYCSIE
jgi:hypothetical protein